MVKSVLFFDEAYFFWQIARTKNPERAKEMKNLLDSIQNSKYVTWSNWILLFF